MAHLYVAVLKTQLVSMRKFDGVVEFPSYFLLLIGKEKIYEKKLRYLSFVFCRLLYRYFFIGFENKN